MQMQAVEFLTTKQVAEMLQCSESILKIWRAKGEGPTFLRLGSRSIRYTRGDVVAWMLQQQIAA